MVEPLFLSSSLMTHWDAMSLLLTVIFGNNKVYFCFIGVQFKVGAIEMYKILTSSIQFSKI